MSINTQIYALLGHGTYFDGEPLVGVEVEIEGAQRVHGQKYWRVEYDGSLRDGVELVLREPLRGADLDYAFRDLDKLFRVLEKERPIILSHRTSVHCHVDCRQYTADQVLSIILAYAAVEAALFNLAGKYRYDNIYCPGLTACYKQVQDLSRLARGVQVGDTARFRRIVQTWEKYSCVNIGALATFGSIEFRALSGSTDVKRIRHWVDVLKYMVQGAAKMSVAEIEARIKTDHKGLAIYLLGEHMNMDMMTTWTSFQTNNKLNCLDILNLEQARQAEEVRGLRCAAVSPGSREENRLRAHEAINEVLRSTPTWSTEGATNESIPNIHPPLDRLDSLANEVVMARHSARSIGLASNPDTLGLIQEDILGRGAETDDSDEEFFEEPEGE